VFHLFRNTYLDIQGASSPPGYKSQTADHFTINDVASLKSNDKIIYYVPKFTFTKVVIEYIKELFATANPFLVKEIHSIIMARMTYQLAYLTDNQTRNTYIDCNLPTDSVNVLIEITKYRGLFEGDFKRHIGIEWLLCDYFNQGIYSDEFQKRFRELLVKNIVYSVQEIKHEMLYKVFNLPKMYLNYDTVEELFSKDMGVQFLFDPNLNNSTHLMTRYKIEDIADLFHTFTKLYNKGYDKAKYQEMTLLSLFLHKANACLQNGSCDALMKEEIQRDFSIIFGHHRFMRKMNCLLIDWIYKQKREKNPDLELLSL
jgi:hypothetical protein